MTLRHSLVRLASENPALRPHLLPILASTVDLVDRLRQVFTPDFLWEAEPVIKTKVLKTTTEEYDATWFEDKWSYSRDTHYTEDHGFLLEYEHASQVLCEVTAEVADLPFGSDEQHIERVVKNLSDAHVRQMFQEQIQNEGDPWDVLEKSLEVKGGSFTSGGAWKVKRADVRTVNARVKGEVATVTFTVLLDIEYDTSDVEAEVDEPDYDPPERDDYDYGGRYASDRKLRANLIRIAHSRPEFRKDILPLVSKVAREERGPGGLIFSLDDGFAVRTTPSDPPYNQTYRGLLLVQRAKKPYQAALQVVRTHKDEIFRMKTLGEVVRFISEKVRALGLKDPELHSYSMPD